MHVILSEDIKEQLILTLGDKPFSEGLIRGWVDEAEQTVHCHRIEICSVR